MKNIKGFSLIELLVVIAIIGILVTIAVIAINPARLIGEARDSKKRQEMQELKHALQLYFNDNQSAATQHYPKDNASQAAECTNLTTKLVTAYTRQLPAGTCGTDWVYRGENYPAPINVPDLEYRAAVTLQYPTPEDTATFAKCGGVAQNPTGWDTTYQYFICPD
ncbi:MAG: type II secretion system protein [Candidatus Woykebacteria bacterium]